MQPHHVSDAMLARMFKRQLVPLTDISPKNSLLELESLPADEQHTAAIINKLLTSDWLILADTDKDVIYFLKYQSYEFIPHQAHLYVKHYAKVSHLVKSPISTLNRLVAKEILETDHLQTTGETTSYILQKYETELKRYRLKNVSSIRSVKKRKNVPINDSPILRKRVSRNGPVIIRRPGQQGNSTNKTTRKIPQPYKVPAEYAHLVRPGEYLTNSTLTKRIKKYQKHNGLQG